MLRNFSFRTFFNSYPQAFSQLTRKNLRLIHIILNFVWNKSIKGLIQVL